MPVRNREYTKYVITGSVRSGGTSWDTGALSEHASTTDVTNEGPNQTFRSTKYFQSGGLINGGSSIIRYSNAASVLSQTYAIGDHLPVDTMGNSTAASLAVARTNPSRANVDVPNLLWELRELPDLVRRFHERSIRHNFADANLRVQFGIIPLGSDLDKLFLFTNAVNKRVKDLKNLRNRGLARTVNLDSGSNSETGFISVNSGYAANYNNQRYRIMTQESVWGHVKWVAQPPLFRASDAKIEQLARRAVYGLTVDFKTAWEAIPWSWLVDWFSNAGSILEANRNIIGAEPSLPLIMRKTTTTMSVAPGSNGITTLSGLEAKLVTKRRDPSTYSLTASLPLLNGGQWSIIGSLAATRGIGR